MLPPGIKDWFHNGLAHFVIAVAQRAAMSASQVNDRNPGKPQYHPRMMLALPTDAYANGLCSSRRIERARHHDLGLRRVTANTVSVGEIIPRARTLPASDLHIRLIDAPTGRKRPTPPPAVPLLDLGRIFLNSAVDCRVINRDAAFAHHLL